MHHFALAAIWFAGASCLPGVAQADTPLYTVAVDGELSTLSVEACFERVLPSRMVAHNDNAARYLRATRVSTADRNLKLKPHRSGLHIPLSGKPGCIDYRVDLDAIPTDSWRRGTWRTPNAMLLNPDLWLWYPGDHAAIEGFEIRFRLPPGMDVSAPWTRIDISSGSPRFRVNGLFAGWYARMAIGHFTVENLARPGGRLRLAILPGDPPQRHNELRAWIASGADALATAYGQLPVPDAQVLVVPIGKGGEPVPWGEVQRGGGDSVQLYVDQRRPLGEFMADWVLVHELSHLLHPAIASHDRWLSEGIASYYQNVLRARAGLVDAQWAWEELHAGFERGIRGTPPGRSLAEASETLMRDHAFMRVYWSGAAIALLADVELRRRTDGGQSLDTALAAFRDCCLPSTRSWSAREMMERLDALTGDSVFIELYDEHVESDDFPDLSDLYDALGIVPLSRTEVRLDPTAEEAAVCEAIMAPLSS